MKLDLPASIERQFVNAHEEWHDSEKVSDIHNQTAMTKVEYRQITRSLFCSRIPETEKYDPMAMFFSAQHVFVFLYHRGL